VHSGKVSPRPSKPTEISIVVVTHNRVHLLRRCVENVVAATSDATQQIIIWDNASLDETADYLAELNDPRITVVHHPENIAMNARRRALELATGDYLVEMDDDVVEAPPNWDQTLLNGYLQLAEYGRLGAFLKYDPDDSASRYLRYMREERGAYPLKMVNGIRILEGTPGGACTMISRELYDRVGGYGEHHRYPYWRPEISFERKMRKLGFRSAYLADLNVRHAGGPNYSETAQPKLHYWKHEQKLRRRKDRVKRVLLALPFVAKLNKRFEWFDLPAPRYDPAAYHPDAQDDASPGPTPAP
jgi:GT2 family glycosyltransferase